MCSWPYGGAEEAIPDYKWFGLVKTEPKYRSEENPKVWTGPGGYFNECMNGFEYQVAWHMIAEGEPNDSLIQQGLAIAKAVHERYGAEKRNPYNEIECSDHYARSMASYGVFISVCGFNYHGPKGVVGFNPQINPHNFRAPFTAAEGWGTYSQTIENHSLRAVISVIKGSLRLNTINLVIPKNAKVSQVKLGSSEALFTQNNQSVEINLTPETFIRAQESISTEIIFN